jgi:prophage regulatory protein
VEADTTVTAELAAVKLLDIRTVADITTLSERSIRRFVNAGKFPRPVRLTPRCARWPADVIKTWLNSRGV